MVHVRWKGLQKSEDTLEPWKNVFEDVLQMLLKRLDRKHTPTSLAEGVRNHLDL